MVLFFFPLGTFQSDESVLGVCQGFLIEKKKELVFVLHLEIDPVLHLMKNNNTEITAKKDKWIRN